jgi:hypothetical protein
MTPTIRQPAYGAPSRGSRASQRLTPRRLALRVIPPVFVLMLVLPVSAASATTFSSARWSGYIRVETTVTTRYTDEVSDYNAKTEEIIVWQFRGSDPQIAYGTQTHKLTNPVFDCSGLVRAVPIEEHWSVTAPLSDDLGESAFVSGVLGGFDTGVAGSYRVRPGLTSPFPRIGSFTIQAGCVQTTFDYTDQSSIGSYALGFDASFPNQTAEDGWTRLSGTWSHAVDLPSLFQRQETRWEWSLTRLDDGDHDGVPDKEECDDVFDPCPGRAGTIIVEKQTSPNAAPGSFTFSGAVAGTIADNGTIVVSNLAPGTYTSAEADPSPIGFSLASIACDDQSSLTASSGNVQSRTATFRVDPGETVKCTFTNAKATHPGTIGFWKNWRNQYSSASFQSLLSYLRTHNPKIYNKDGIANTSDDATIAKIDAILDVGTKTPRDQMILAQLTALKLNLAVTQLDGSNGLAQKNSDLCSPGVVDISGIGAATAFFGTSTPTIHQVVSAVESRWTGSLTTNRSNWTFNLSNNTQRDMVIGVLAAINEGTIVMSNGCP